MTPFPTLVRGVSWLATLVVVGAALAGAAGPVYAQAPASFAGRWRLEGTAPPVDGAGRDVPKTLSIEQTATALVITAPGGRPTAARVTTYKLDGTLSVNTMDNGDQVRSKVRWQGAALIVDGIGALGEEVVTIRETRRLEDGGAVMVVETSAVTNLGGARTETVLTYRRQ